MSRVYVGLAVILALVCPVHNSMEPEKVEDYSSYEHIRDFLKIFFLSTVNSTSYALRFQSALDSVYFLDYNNVSELCSRHISYISAGLKRGDPWSFFFLDSNGHQASDIINGRERYLGSYKECMAIREVVSGDDVIEGSYWNLRILTYIFPNKTALNYFTWHACFPSSCSQGDANIIADTIASANGFEGVYVYVPVLTSTLDDQWFWAAVVILSIFTTICVLGTMIDCLDIVQKKETLEKSQSAGQYYTGETIRLIPAERNWLVKERGRDILLQ
ncbi:hypothetical protein Btru_001644 [Bulinus truncatus]|nr:hypothetical protein Btru_001644 [Bulinus truncatus]